MKIFTPLLRRALIGIFAACALTASAEKGIIVVSPDGSTREYAFDQLRRVSLEADGITVVTPDGSDRVAYADIDRITLNADIHTAVERLAADGRMAVWLGADDATLHLAGAPALTDFSVIDLQGVALLSGRTDAAGSGVADCAALPSGSYILSVRNSHSVKFIKR